MKRKKGFKALAAMILSVSLLVGLVPMTVSADTNVTAYVDENGEEHDLPAGATTLSELSSTLNTGWYVVDDNTETYHSGRVAISGDVTLVLGNTNMLTISGGIRVPAGSSLTVYKATGSSVGLLTANESNSTGNAGIGGNSGEVNGTITIQSIFFLSVTGGADAAGIGTGKEATSGQPGRISINSIGYTASIKGASNGKGIGPGEKSVVGEVSIFDSAMIKCDDEITLLVSDCTKHTSVYISNCNHIADSRYEPYTSTQHKVLCGNCRKVMDYEDHDFGSGDECSLCGAHKTAASECTVTYIVGNDETTETVPIDSVLTKPADPEAEKGMRFVCWVDENGNPFDFSSLITKDITLTATFDYAVVATLKEKTVVFEGVLQLRYTMNISQDLWEDDGAYISFIQAGKDEVKIPITDGNALNQENPYTGDIYYYYPIPIPEYQDVVTVRVYNSEGNTVLFRHISGDSYHGANEESPNGAEYSILSYILAKTGDTSINQLVYALRYYGACAQKKFAYGDNLEEGFTHPTVNIYDSQRAANQVQTSGVRSEVDGLVKASIQVNYEAGNDLRVAFTLEEGASLSDYTFSLDGEPVEPEQVGKNKYAIIVKNIAAPNLASKYAFSIADVDGHAYTVTASVLSYALIAIDANTNEDTVNLCKALWNYCMNAQAYFSH